MQAIILETKINSLIRESVLLNVREIEFKQVLKEVYPYFKHAIDEENAKLRKYMLSEGYISHYEYMLSEQKQLEEGWLDVMADVGITAGQMVGGFVGQAAGLAGVVKYTKDFIGVVDKAFLEMVGPLLGLFFSMQALLFPMPAVGTIKGILLGFFKGVGNVISGAGGLLARGVTALLSRGHGFIGKAIEVLGKALKGITAAIKAGGPTIAKIEGKVGGSMLSKATKAMGTAMENFMKRLGILREGLKSLGKKDVKEVPGMVKDILTKAFKTSKDKLDDAVKFFKKPKTFDASDDIVDAAAGGFSKAFSKKISQSVPDEIGKVSLFGLKQPGISLTGGKLTRVHGGKFYVKVPAKNTKDGLDALVPLSPASVATLMNKNPGFKKYALTIAENPKALEATFKTLKSSGQLSSAVGKGIIKLNSSFKNAIDKYALKYASKIDIPTKTFAITGAGRAKGLKILGMTPEGKVLYQFVGKKGAEISGNLGKQGSAKFGKAVDVFLKYGALDDMMKHFVKQLKGRAFKDFARIIPALGPDAKINKDGSITM